MRRYKYSNYCYKLFIKNAMPKADACPDVY